MHTPMRRTWATKSAIGICTRKPGIDSSLSSVPPVWPRPRPDTIGTATPQAATAGARGSEILSPTPPVECLSTFGRSRSDRSMMSPERSIASAHTASSPPSSPRKKMAISMADTW
jgi:hypothetical protein